MTPAIANARRHGRSVARELGVPCIPARTLKARAPKACFRRWGLPNGIGPTLFGGNVCVCYVDDDAEGKPMLVVTP